MLPLQPLSTFTFRSATAKERRPSQRKGCPESPAALCIKFDHSWQDAASREKMREFWEAFRSLRLLEDKDSAESDEVTEESSASPLETLDLADTMRHILCTLISRGLDKAALAISDKYRVRPTVCCCDGHCACVLFSRQLAGEAAAVAGKEAERLSARAGSGGGPRIFMQGRWFHPRLGKKNCQTLVEDLQRPLVE